MKTLSKLLTLILCFELILGPVGQSVVATQVAEAKDCPAGQVFDGDLGRCVMSAQVIEQNNSALNCGTDKDCYRKNAQDDLNASGASKSNGGLNRDYDPSFNEKGVYQNGKQSVGASIGNAATIAIPALVATSVLIEQQQAKARGQSFKCNPPSLLLMFAGAAALGLGEIIGYFKHKSKLEDIKEEWDKTSAPTGTGSDDKKRAEATEAQSQAFEFLAQNEEQVAKTAKQKKGFYLAATGLFAAGALAATVEAIQYKVAKTYISTGYQIATTAAAADPVNGAALKAAADKKLQLSQNRVRKLTCQTDATQKEIDADKNIREGHDKKKADEKKAKQDLRDKNKLDRRIKKQIKKNSNPKDIYDNIDYPDDGNFNAYVPSLHRKSEVDEMKRIAARNLSTAKDAEQFLQLMEEYVNIEFENYSKMSYLDEEITPVNELKKIRFESHISSAIAAIFVPEAFAETEEEKQERLAKEEEAKAAKEQKEAEEKAAKEAKKAKNQQILMSLAGALPLILTQVKFKDGKPVDKETMQGSMRVVKDKVIKAVAKPWTRIAINGVFGTWMGIQSHHMQKQHDASMQRADMLRKMKEDFKTASGLAFCTEKDRSDAGKPKCYCFTADNKKNPAREKSQICSTVFAAYNKPGQNYDSSKTCLDASMKTDPSCSCKNKRGPDGKNTCYRSSRGVNFAGFSPGTFRMLSTVSSPADDLFGGVMDGASIDAAAGVNAAKVQRAAEDMLAKTDPILASQSKKVGDDFSKSLIAATGGMSMGGGGASALPSSPKAAAAALAEELKKEEEAPIVTASDLSNEGSFTNEGVEEDTPEFGLNEGQLESQETEIQEIMSQDLDMAQSDISTGSDTNIFDLLSNRYRRSGMRRLFEKEEEVKADAPAKTDIAE